VLAIVATIFSIVPIFGAIMSSIPAVVVALTQSLGSAVFVLAWIIGIHQIEANFLNPKIMGDAAKLHPVLVIFSLLAGEHHFGVAGALFAVPCMSILQSIFLHFRFVVHRGEPAFSGEALLTAPPVEHHDP
jgi:predicted PurR-regulated permease PerM